jgi:hypothetical protein
MREREKLIAEKTSKNIRVLMKDPYVRAYRDKQLEIEFLEYKKKAINPKFVEYKEQMAFDFAKYREKILKDPRYLRYKEDVERERDKIRKSEEFQKEVAQIVDTFFKLRAK